MKVPVKDIIVAERIRKDTGDLTTLMESMKNHGLLNPIAVSRKMELIAGHRRLAAAKKLGWESIECNILSLDTKLERLNMEAEENITRKDFTAEELARYQEMKRDLTVSSFQKFLQWMGRIVEKIKLFFASLFKKKNK